MTVEEALAVADRSSRERILAATAEVLGRNGMTKLSLSEVALRAGVSRPTLYRWFASKRELLDAALRVIVAYQQSYPGLRMIDIEPAHVIKRLSRVIPLMRHRLERLAPGPDPALAVATAVRVAVSHYLVRSDDDDDFLNQLRHAARIKHYSPEGAS
jgi:AcrR family transcriptional regulator